MTVEESTSTQGLKVIRYTFMGSTAISILAKSLLTHSVPAPWRSTLKGKYLLLREQILFFKSQSHFGMATSFSKVQSKSQEL